MLDDINSTSPPPVPLEVWDGHDRIQYQQFAKNRLTPQQNEYLFLELRETFEAWNAQRDADLETQAIEIVTATLTDDWRRLIGNASRLVETLMLLRVQAELATGQTTTGHAFSSQDDLAAHIGVTARTLRNWLAKDYAGAQWLNCWLSKRTWYVTREDGFKSRGGTLWRVETSPRPCSDRTRAANPSYDALRTPWRSSRDLPGSVALETAELEQRQLENTVVSDKGNFKAGQDNVPHKQGRLLIQVEGQHRDLHLPFELRCFHTGNLPKTPAQAKNAATWGKAEIVAAKLSDVSSTPFWVSMLRRLERAGQGDGVIWSAVGQALEAGRAGTLTRGTVAGYAVGILRRTLKA